MKIIALFLLLICFPIYSQVILDKGEELFSSEALDKASSEKAPNIDIPDWVPKDQIKVFKIFLKNYYIVDDAAREYSAMLEADTIPTRCRVDETIVHVYYSKGTLELKSMTNYAIKVSSCKVNEERRTISVRFKKDDFSILDEIKDKALYVLGGLVVGVALAL